MGCGRNDVIGLVVFPFRETSIAKGDVIPAKAGIQENAGFRIKPVMADGIRFMSLSMLALLLLIFPVATSFAEEGQVLRPTLSSMDFYGSIEGANAGDELRVYDSQGVLSGRFIVKEAGRYGFLHVYGDDRATEVDEGASLNDPLAFYLNGNSLHPLISAEVLWLGDGQRMRVDFTGR